jgi:CheY-like chemotaxis protein
MQRTALLVDDSRVARMTLKKLLMAHDFDVTEVGSGEEAINYLQTVSVLPQIIFMDVMMDGIDGLTATRQIKSDFRLSGIPVVICTGNDSETDIENALSTGAMGVLSKPPAEAALADILTQFEQQLQFAASPEPEPFNIDVNNTGLDFEQPMQPVEFSEPVTTNETMTGFGFEQPMPVSQPEFVPDTQSAPYEPVPVNNTLDVNELTQTIKNELQVSLTDSLSQLVDERAQQIINNALQATLESSVKMAVDALTPSITEQVTVTVAQKAQAIAEETSKHTTRDVVTHTVGKSVQRAIAELDLTGMVQQTLQAEMTSMLAQQEQMVLANVTAQLQATIQTVIDQNLEASLQQRISPIVADILAVELAKEATPNPLETMIVSQAASISTLKKLMTVMGLAVIGLAAGVAVALL